MDQPLVTTNGKVAYKPPRYSLAKLDAQALQVMWPKFIRPGLVRIKEKDPHSGQWLPEHVRAAIDRGHLGMMFCECHLIVPVSESKPVGFVVLRLYNDEYLQVPLSLFAWIIYGVDPSMRGLKAGIGLHHVLPLIEKRARDIGVRYVDGVTSRMGWLRRLQPYGYSMHQMIIRKEIT